MCFWITDALMLSELLMRIVTRMLAEAVDEDHFQDAG